jgi:hypothetical protein
LGILRVLFVFSLTLCAQGLIFIEIPRRKFI